MKVPGRRRDWRPWLVFAGVALLSFLLYLPTLKYEFVWDDGAQIRDNEHLVRLSPVRVLFSGYVLDPKIALQTGTFTYYRPLPILSFQLEKKLYGNNPAGYHFNNVLLHAVAVLLVCAVLFVLCGSIWWAAAGGLLFALHPALHSVVTFVSNRTYLLAGVFLLLALWALLQGQKRRQTARRKPSGWWPFLYGLAFFLALLSLESCLLFGLVTLVWLLLTQKSYVRPAVWFLASVLPPLAYLVLRLLVARVPFAETVIGAGLARPLTILNNFGQQTLSFLVPAGLKLVQTDKSIGGRFSGYTLVAGIFLLLPLVWYFVYARHRSQARAETNKLLLGFALAVFLHLPFAHMLEKGPAGRMLYLAGPGIVLMLLVLARQFVTRVPQAGPVLGLGTLAVASVFFIVSRQQTAFWSTDLSLFRRMLAQQPDYLPASQNLALAHMQKGSKDSALVYLERTLALDSTYAKAYEVRGLLYAADADYQRAVEDFTRAIAYDSTFVTAYYNRGLAYLRMNQLEPARRDYDRAMQLAPDWADVYLGRGTVSLQQGEIEEAIKFYTQALKLKPEFADAWANRGCAYLLLGNYKKALADCDQALRLQPGSVTFLVNRAMAYMGAKEYALALADYEDALRRESGLAQAHYGRARALDLLNRREEAITAYETFLSLRTASGAQADTARQRIRILRGR